MRRRAFLGLAVLGAFTRTAVSASSSARLAWLSVAPHPGINGFRAGMRELGWVEGETLTIDYAYASGRPERLPELATAIALSSAGLVVASGSDAVLAARSVIREKPVVAVSTASAIGAGENLSSRPSNLTGVALLFDVTAAKWAEALSEVLAPSSSIGVIHDASVSNLEQFETVRRSARLLGHEASAFPVESIDGVEGAIGAARQAKVAGLVFASSPLFTANAARLAELVRASGLPAIFESRWIVERGGLMSYGPDLDAVFRRAASLADRILKGAAPSELPIEQPTKFDFALNRGTARALGLNLPTSLLLRADEVIE